MVQSSPVETKPETTRHSQFLCLKPHTQPQLHIAYICNMQIVSYQGGLGGVPALALLLQTSNKLVLGAHHGGEGSVFLLQLPVVTGHLQCLRRSTTVEDQTQL